MCISTLIQKSCWIKSWVIWEEIGDHWLDIQGSQLDGLTAEICVIISEISVEIGIKPQTNKISP